MMTSSFVSSLFELSLCVHLCRGNCLQMGPSTDPEKKVERHYGYVITGIRMYHHVHIMYSISLTQLLLLLLLLCV
jgi:hypothetical protein